MESSSSNQHVTVEVGEEFQNPYPYPSNVYTPSFVSLKLSGGRENFLIWEAQMICLLKSHDMSGFVDGTYVSPQHNVNTGKEKVGEDDQLYHYRLRMWARSDALVKGWILGSLSENALTHVWNHLQEKLQHRNAATEDSTAKDVWDELHTIYGPPQLVSADDEEEEEKVLPGAYKSDLHRYTKATDHNSKYETLVTLRTRKVTSTEKLTNKGNTALHLAVANSTQGAAMLEVVLQWTPENTNLLDVRNSDGHTLLHVAATVGNTEVAKILVGRDPALLFARDNKSHTPLALAVSGMQSEMSKFLLHHMKTAIQGDRDTSYSVSTGDELPFIAISCGEFRLALDLLEHQREVDNDSQLMALAQNFPRDVNKERIYRGIVKLRRMVGDYFIRARTYVKERCGSLVLILFTLLFLSIPYIFILLPLLLTKNMLAWIFAKKTVQVHEDAMKLLQKVCALVRWPDKRAYFTKPLFEATRENAYKVVDAILCYFSRAIWILNEDGHNIMQYAVLNRSEKIYNILYHRKEYKNTFRTMKDSSGNNLLHLAARLAPPAKLNRISGAALQIQHELQWFKEVEGYISPLQITQKNSFNETPKMVFTREHKNLVIEGEKWLKAAAESYTITAALITTIVFAAAITVPGGSNQDSGIPIFTKKNAFKIFAISDAISLFTSVTSLLMFLSILTARFSEKDFLFKLPTKLIIGLTTLFISTTAMIIAFGATLHLVFGQGNSRLLIPIAVLTCLPITSFVTLQIPFIIELISSTYGPSIFQQKAVEWILYG